MKTVMERWRYVIIPGPFHPPPTVKDAGSGFLLTVKDNQLKLHQNIEKLLPAPKADSPPLDSRRPPSIATSSTKRAVT